MVISSVSSVGDTNKYAILNKIRSNGGITREELAHTLSLSAPAISKNVASLIEAGIIYENGTVGSVIGRKPVMLYYNFNIMYVIGVEIMPQGIRGALADFSGTIMESFNMPSEIEKGSGHTLNNLFGMIDRLLAKADSADKVRCIAVAAPGSGENASRYSLMWDYQKDWGEIDLAVLLRSHYNIDILVNNDVEMDLIGEHWRGAGKGHSDMMLFKYGDGFACRAMRNGELFAGANHFAGDIGLFLEDYRQGRSSFTLPGALEKELCLTLGEAYAQASGKKDIPGRLPPVWLIKAAKEGDEAAAGVLERVVKKMAVAMTNTVLVMNPELVILGGAAAQFEDGHVQMLQDFLQANCPCAPMVIRASLAEQSGIYGCIKTAISRSESFLVDLWK